LPEIHPVASEYLERLKRASAMLPRGARRELLADVEAHLSEATDPGMSEAEVLTVLDRLGEPDEIVAEQFRDAAPMTNRRGTKEWAAIWLLLFGGFFFGVGWVVGLICLWSSDAWRTRDKWLGTLLVPGGLAFSFLFVLVVSSASLGATCGGSSISTYNATTGASTTVSVPTTCTGGSSGVVQVLLGVLLVALLLAPFFTAAYLARRAGKAAPAHA
jgi:hypothetical protein